MGTNSSTMTRAAVYARVSTSDKGQNPENQLEQLREYCRRQGWTITVEYIDHETAKHGNRGAFKRLFDDASRRAFDVLVVWALDRLTREGVWETFAYIRKLASYGVQFESFTEAHFRTTGPAGELMLAIAAWIAKQERARIVERTKAGLERARKAGKVLGRPKVVLDRVRLAELRDSGTSWRDIAKTLGISTGTARKVYADDVRKSLGSGAAADGETKRLAVAS